MEDLFFQNDAKLVLSQKPVVVVEDFWCWDHTKSGYFTVKSGNWLANKLNNADLLCEAEAQPSLNILKKQIWKVQTVPKIKAFLWRAFSGALPVAELMNSRGMPIDLRCQSCGMEGESINHVLFTCTVARQLWALLLFPSPLGGFDELSLHSNFNYLLKIGNLKSVPLETRRLFPWILWRLWKNRNLFVFEAKLFCPLDSVVKIKEDADFWSLSQSVNSECERIESKAITREDIGWKPPSANWFKCNIGAFWCKHKKIGGCAWVLRDHNGFVVLHSRRSFANIINSDELHLQSILWSIDCMQKHRLNKVIFASEKVELVGALNRPKAWPNFSYHFSVLNQAFGKFSDWRFVYEHQVANRGASLIAQSASKESFAQSYVAIGCPLWLHELFDSERLLSSVV